MDGASGPQAGCDQYDGSLPSPSRKVGTRSIRDDQTGDPRPSLQMGHSIGFPNRPASLSFTCANLLQSTVREMNCLPSERLTLTTL